jgi:adenylate cyclase
MSAELTLQSEGKPARKFPVGKVCSIGRGPSNDVVLDDNRASRNHAIIQRQGDQTYVLRDLGSSNGTLLNNRRVSIPSPLKTGDEIRIASSHLFFTHEIVEDAAGGDNQSVERTQMDFTSETISILVVDIRNYTVLSEAIPPEDLSRLLGKWFQDVAQVIEGKKGTIDKFIGDAVYAYWNKGHTQDEKAYVLGAIQTALELVKLAQTFHEELSTLYPNYAFHVGCGLNAGKAIIGSVGGFTAVGDCVNVAFRLESLCKELGQPIILSEEVKLAAGADFEFQDLGAHKLKGKSQELRVFTIPLLA